jgi:hypothetical protein
LALPTKRVIMNVHRVPRSRGEKFNQRGDVPPPEVHTGREGPRLPTCVN